MEDRSFKTRVRGALNTACLNSIFTSLIDLIRPKCSLGDKGELAAERLLLKMGLIILHRGYNDGIGELDLVAVDEETIVFVEVKTRSSDHAGMPVEAVDAEKQHRISKTALSYLKHFDLLGHRVRFDVISVLWPDKSRSPTFEHIENAFETAGTSF